MEECTDLTAKSLTLVAEDGTHRMRLLAQPNGAYLGLYGADGTVRAEVGVEDDAAHVTLLGAQGVELASLQALGGMVLLRLHDAAGVVRLRVSLGPLAIPSVCFYDAQGHMRADIAVWEQCTECILRDADGVARAGVGVAGDGEVRFVTGDDDPEYAPALRPIKVETEAVK